MATGIFAFPPTVNSFLPAIPINELNLNIPFIVPSLVNWDAVQHMAVRIVKLNNNQTVVKREKYFDGIIYLQKPDIIENQGVLSIDLNELQLEDFEANTYLKIQLRFGYNSLDDFQIGDKVSYLQWKNQQNISNSEWSNVITAKFLIVQPVANILNNNFSNNISDVLYPQTIISHSVNIEYSRFPEFKIEYKNLSILNNQQNVLNERLLKYQLILLKENLEIDKYEIVEDSGQLSYEQNNNDEISSIIVYRFKSILLPDINYKVQFKGITENAYEISSQEYFFQVTELPLESLNNIALLVVDNDDNYSSLFKYETDDDLKSVFKNCQKYGLLKYNDKLNESKSNKSVIYYVKGDSNIEASITKQEIENFINNYINKYEADENAVLQIYLKNNPYGNFGEVWNLDGTYYLIRASEKDNYAKWEDLAEFTFYDEEYYNDGLKLLYEDFTIESGVKYKYGLQKKSIQNYRYSPKFENDTLENSPSHQSNFEYSYLYYNGVQLKLNLDIKMQSIKKNKLFQKQDSLNSRYPIILRNGLANYTEFQLGAKITLHSDDSHTFFLYDETGGGYYFNNEIIISKDKFWENYKGIYASSFNFNHTKNNVFMERRYRECVESFLNDGSYKLFKSPTEGNMIITLVNVSLTPNQQLGRLISDFTSTAYEIADNNLENMQLYNINPLDMVSNAMKLNKKKYNTSIIKNNNQIRNAFDGKYIKKNRISIEEYNILQSYYNNLDQYFILLNNYYWFNFEELPKNLKEFLYNKSQQVYDFNNPNWDSQDDNLLNWIYEQEETEISNETIYSVSKINYLQFEIYPKYNIEQEILNLKAKQLNNKIDLLKNQLLIAKYQLILKQYEKSQSNPITLILTYANNTEKEIIIMPGQKYNLYNSEDLINIYLKYTRPVLINYGVTKEIYLNNEKINLTLSTKKVNNIDQISGVFTNNKSILNNFEFPRNINSYLVNSKYNMSLWQNQNITECIYQNTHDKIFKLFKSINYEYTKNELEEKINKFLDANNLSLTSFEEQVKQIRQLLKLYTPLTTIEKTETEDIWQMSGKDIFMIYRFINFNTIEIEAESGTQIRVITLDSQDIEQESTIIIGPTNKYRLSDVKIKSLEFINPSFAIINYASNIVLEIQQNKQGGQ